MTTPILEPPESAATHGYVTARVIRRVSDSSDANDKPDILPGQGTITFTPRRGMEITSNYNAFLINEPIVGVLDTQGRLIRHHPSMGEIVVPGIWLPVGIYGVTFNLERGSLSPINNIEVTSKHTVNSPLHLEHATEYIPPVGVSVQTLLVKSSVLDNQLLVKKGNQIDGVDATVFDIEPIVQDYFNENPIVVSSKENLYFVEEGDPDLVQVGSYDYDFLVSKKHMGKTLVLSDELNSDADEVRVLFLLDDYEVGDRVDVWRQGQMYVYLAGARTINQPDDFTYEARTVNVNPPDGYYTDLRAWGSLASCVYVNSYSYEDTEEYEGDVYTESLIYLNFFCVGDFMVDDDWYW